MSKLILLLPFLFLSVATADDIVKRSVSFDWEAIEQAKGYEVEITPMNKGGKSFSFKTKEPVFNGKLNPGRYKMHLRSLDSRGTPGTWSEDTLFEVQLSSVKVTFPTQNQNISSKEKDADDVEFKWAPLSGAKSYRIEWISEDGKINETKEVKENEWEFKLPVSMKYTFKITGLGKDGLTSESTTVVDFTHLGQKIEKPVIEKPNNEFVRELKWSKPELAENYTYLLARYNEKLGKWQKVSGSESFTEERLDFDPKWPGGKYRLSVRAAAKFRENSEVAVEKFDVKMGDRSPAAEYVTTVRESIDRVRNWYSIASWLITSLNYSSDFGNGRGISFSAIGGTGRLGLGWFDEGTPWGFLGIMDMSGFFYQPDRTTGNQSNPTYSSIEASGMYRWTVNDTNEFRSYFGLYRKDIPHSVPRDIDGASWNTSDSSIDFVGSTGLHVGGEYWFSMTPKLGLQLNAHYYQNLSIHKKPAYASSANISPTLQYGLMGSYRLRKNFTGLMGLTYKSEATTYLTSKQIGLSGSSEVIAEGTSVKTTINGMYLSFFAEYDF